jgi:TolB-like protein
MTSIIEGFNYDIFISYRQKDNKFDGWVTRFVGDLKKELEATFKEDISIYFDENPHDGLLETHIVDSSLKEKLKCLIFIPIISQTYCDPKSFAWQNELMAFNKMAKEDAYGRDITLANGNVASRILSVKIHELDAIDQKVFEDETGGVLRAIEFIYSEPGVNRPLNPDDDARENLNRTKYRNQINKVANAVKDIIESIKKGDKQGEEILKNVKKGKPVPSRFLNKRIIIASIITSALILFGIFFIPRLLKSLEPIEKSIAVLPFRNDSPDDSTQYFIDGVMEELLTNLQKIKELRVLGRTSVEQYRSQNKTIPQIAQELGINYIIEGSGQKSGNSFRMRVQLIRANKEDHIWANTFEQENLNLKDYFKVQANFAESIARELDAAITPGEKQLMETIPTERLEAYDAYLKGHFYLQKITPNDMDIAMQYFELANELDTDFALAYVGIGSVWLGRQVIGAAVPEEAGPKVLTSFMKALELDSTLAEVHYTLAIMNTFGMWDWKSAESEFKKANAINPNYSDARAMYSHLLNFLGRPKEAMEQMELALKLDPHNPTHLVTYSHDLLFVQRYDEVISVSRELFDKNPTMFVALDPLFQALHLEGRYKEAFEVMKDFYSNMYIDFDHVFDQYDKLGYAGTLSLEGDTLLSQSKTKYILPIDIAYLYIFSGNKERALVCLEQSYKLHDPNMPYITRPTYAILRDEPRFQDLLRKLNLTFNY